MKDITIFLKELSYESGVYVSVKHLCANLENSGITFEVVRYCDDADLLCKVMRCDSRCINLQVPSFSDETLEKILQCKDNVVVSIHSTICNLQVEEGSLERIIRWGNSDYTNLRFTCPDHKECVGFNAVMKRQFIWLPNTFSYDCSHIDVASSAAAKVEKDGKKDISLVCAYRPLKNMMIQLEAVVMLSKKMPVRLHMFGENPNSPVYRNLVALAQHNNLELVVHPQMNNQQCFDALQQMDLGLQVSLSETYSYVAFEHMIQGIPVVASSSVSFASEVVRYNSANDICAAMEKILDKNNYEKYCIQAQQSAAQRRQQDICNARDAVRYMVYKTTENILVKGEGSFD